LNVGQKAGVRKASEASQWIWLAITIALAGCEKRTAGRASIPQAPSGAVSHYTYEVINDWPHDPRAFTQGLVFRNGSLLESTGLHGESSLREVEWQTGRVLKRVAVARQYFAEGLTVIGSKAYQLTWQNRKGFIYDADTFQMLGEFAFEGEGWGLTTDGKFLLVSDGTNRIRFIDSTTFIVARTLEVHDGGKKVDQLNELEFIRGEIFANVWQTDHIVRIDAATGGVRGVIDFTGLLALGDRDPATDVLNGIAYDPDSDRLFVTGKRWPKLFEVRLKPRP
jgi:glutaminyl-peptide cyclotransferase